MNTASLGGRGGQRFPALPPRVLWADRTASVAGPVDVGDVGVAEALPKLAGVVVALGGDPALEVGQVLGLVGVVALGAEELLHVGPASSSGFSASSRFTVASKQLRVGAEQDLALLLDVVLGGGGVAGSAEVPVVGEGVGPLLALLADVAGRGAPARRAIACRHPPEPQPAPASAAAASVTTMSIFPRWRIFFSNPSCTSNALERRDTRIGRRACSKSFTLFWGARDAQGNETWGKALDRVGTAAALLLAAGLATIAAAKPHRPKTTTKRITVRSNGSEVNADNDFGAVSGNGRFVTFESVGKFTKGDSPASEDVFRHDRKTGKTRRVSLKSNGKQVPGGDANDSSISKDGRFVAFHAAGAFVPGDNNGTDDVYVKDMKTGKVRRASVRSDGSELPYDSLHPAISGQRPLRRLRLGGPLRRRRHQRDLRRLPP